MFDRYETIYERLVEKQTRGGGGERERRKEKVRDRDRKKERESGVKLEHAKDQ